MSSVYLRRASSLIPGDVILLAGPVYVRPERIDQVKRLPDDDEAQIIELTFAELIEGETRVLGFPLDTVVTTLDPLEPWPA